MKLCQTNPWPGWLRRNTMPVLIFWISLCLYLDTTEAQGRSGIVTYSIREEQLNDTFIGNIVTDANLNIQYSPSTLSDFRYQFTSANPAHASLFRLGTMSGQLRTAQVIDRDQICPKQITCEISLDITIRPSRYFQIIKVVVQIIDKNDNQPTFPEPRIQISIAETTARDATFAVSSAVDPDSGDYGIKRYWMTQSSSNKFELRVTADADGSTDLQLVLKDKLDREVNDFYFLTIFAADGGDPARTGSVQAEIIVVDANDNNPRFENKTYEVSLPENTPAQTPIIQVKAFDLDDGQNGKVVYGFTRETIADFGDVFGIDVESGRIHTKVALDYEVNQSYHLRIVAFDRGPNALAAYTKVIVRVWDVNDHSPEIRINSLTETGVAEISEMSDIGAFVAHISVFDPDSGVNGQFTCSMVSNDFQLRPLAFENEYKIVTTTRFDREVKDHYDVDIRCQDKGSPVLTSQAHIVINVKDENDHGPEFPHNSYSLSFKEGNDESKFLIQINASDKDIGKNARVHYRIEAVNGFQDLLRVEEFTGRIFASGQFDHEEKEEYEYLLIATDEGIIPRSATTTLGIHIIDINDEPPMFLETQYKFATYENQHMGTEVGSVSAIDKDGEPFNEVTYSLDYRDRDAQSFKIDAISGKIVNLMYLDREAKSEYHFVVVAQNPGFSLSSTAQVRVLMGDKNDNAPHVFYPNKDNDTYEVDSILTNGDIIVRVDANDADVGNNGKLKFQIVEGDPEHIFDIHPDTGTIFAIRDLYPFGDLLYSLTILVEDRGSPTMSAVAVLNIFINGSLAALHGIPRVGPLMDTTVVIVVCATLLSFLLVVGIILIVVLWRRRQDMARRQHKYNCRVEASKMLAGEAGLQKGLHPGAVEVGAGSDRGSGIHPAQHGPTPGQPWPVFIDSYTAQNPQAHSSMVSVGTSGDTKPRPLPPSRTASPGIHGDPHHTAAHPHLPGPHADPHPGLAAHQYAVREYPFHEEPRHRLLYTGADRAAAHGTGHTGEDTENISDQGSLTDSGKGPSEEGDVSRPSPIDPQFWGNDKGPKSHKGQTHLEPPPALPPKGPALKDRRGGGQQQGSWDRSPRGSPVPSCYPDNRLGSLDIHKKPHPTLGVPNIDHVIGTRPCGENVGQGHHLPQQSPLHHHHHHPHKAPCPKHGQCRDSLERCSSPHYPSDKGNNLSSFGKPLNCNPGNPGVVGGFVSPQLPSRSDLESSMGDAGSDSGTTTSGSYVVDLTEVEEEVPHMSADVYV